MTADAVSYQIGSFFESNGKVSATSQSKIKLNRNRFDLTALVPTFRWSNFDCRDPKMGVFLQSTEATPCGRVLK